VLASSELGDAGVRHDRAARRSTPAGTTQGHQQARRGRELATVEYASSPVEPVHGKGGTVRTVLLDDRGYVVLLRFYLARAGYTAGPLFHASVNGRGPLSYDEYALREGGLLCGAGSGRGVRAAGAGRPEVPARRARLAAPVLAVRPPGGTTQGPSGTTAANTQAAINSLPADR
jgi:hypothetical protein